MCWLRNIVWEDCGGPWEQHLCGSRTFSLGSWDLNPAIQGTSKIVCDRQWIQVHGYLGGVGRVLHQN